MTDYSATEASDERAELGESPIWDGKLLRWLDITGQKLFALDSDGRTTTTTLDMVVTAIALGPDEPMLVATRHGIGWMDERTGKVEQVLHLLDDDTMTMNDGAVDVSGRFWVGSATLDQTDRGSLYRLNGSTLDVVATNIMMSNGIDWSPDGRLLYHADSDAGSVVVWSFDPATGDVTDSRTFLTIPTSVGVPDGLTVDVAGNVWLAVWGAGEVWCLDGRSGRRLGVVSVPTPSVSSCAFGGATLDTLFITTAEEPDDSRSGLLYSTPLEVSGFHPHRFSGGL